jgi:hypothetical protein
VLSVMTFDTGCRGILKISEASQEGRHAAELMQDDRN